VKANLQSVTVGELLEGARGSAQAFTKAPVNLRITAGAALTLRADAELVKLLFSNLINNSCKYNARSPVEIEVAAAADSDRLVLRYTDNGTGIPKDDWEAVFTEFVRSRSSGTASGFGLGLALCRRIMDVHDGTIVVADSSDAGTTFEMAFVAPAGKASQP
jgi:K+-sensing histidine kinase KdpD